MPHIKIKVRYVTSWWCGFLVKDPVWLFLTLNRFPYDADNENRHRLFSL